MYFFAALDNLYFTPAFAFDAKLACEAERWSVALIDKNLADRRYFEPFPAGHGLIAPGEPLTVYVVATAKYQEEPAAASRAGRSSSASISAPSRITMVEIQIHTMKPITAPSEP